MIKINCTAKDYLNLEDLIIIQGNLKELSKENYNRLDKSIKKHGILSPFHIWDDKGNKKLLDGTQRTKYLKQKKEEGDSIPKLPVTYITATNEKDAREKLLALVSQYGKLTEEGLYEYLSESGIEVSDVDIDCSLPEIDMGHFSDGYFNDESKDEVEDNIPEIDESKIVCKLGDLWTLGDHRVLCGDCTIEENVNKLMNGEKADMVFTDPPYGIDVVQSNSVGGGGPTKFGTVGAGQIVPAKTYKKIEGDNNTNAAKDFYNMCVNCGFDKIILFGGNYFTDFLPPSRCWLVWDKEMTGNFSQAEMAWTSLTVGGVRVFKFLWNGLSREGNRKDELKGRIHPTQKPVGLFEQIFERIECKSIFDGFLGSGSTLIACEKTNRKCYGIEIDPYYCDVILQRYLDYSGKMPIRQDGKTFQELKANIK